MLIRIIFLFILLSACSVNKPSINEGIQIESHREEINRVIIEGFDIDTTNCKPYLL